MLMPMRVLHGLVLFGLLNFFYCIKLEFGDCPVYFLEPCTPDTVKFFISINGENGTETHPLSIYKPKLPIGYNVLVPLKVVIHGYGGPSVDSGSRNVTVAYQEVGYNVLIVDWEPLARLPCYTTAYLNTWHVGQCLALLMGSMVPLGFSPELLHVVGFSLGAHIAGFAGANLKNSLGMSFDRITGLDPALPFFATLKNDWKLDSSDARFVDVIHTSAGTIGKLEATGHVDFYVNGGFIQPSCYSRPYPPLCSHIMAGIYFAESIRSAVTGGTSFIGRQCDNLVHYTLGFCVYGKTGLMGELTYTTLRGTYFVETSDEAPYALGRWFLFKTN